MKNHGSKHHVVLLGLIATVSFFWFLFRTGQKPSRIVYPCQRAAMGNIHVFLVALYLPFFSSAKALERFLHEVDGLSFKAAILSSSLILSFTFVAFYVPVSSTNTSQVFSIKLDPQEALDLANSSDLFFIQNASRANGDMDSALTALFCLMGSQGLRFYNTSNCINGLIGKEDLVIIKVNCQWPERGGTNTDLIKSLIDKILSHPEGFEGEIVIADNGQGRGSLNWTENNAFDHYQSMQDVADLFGSSRVSTFLWDRIRRDTVEYEQGQFIDGYVFNSSVDSTTGLCFSYPKFQTMSGTYVSFRKGVWNNATSSYEPSKLKVINIPVLKSHQNYGVTGCVKHYMGVVRQQILPIDRNAHNAVARGAMGMIMAETRFPTLNILDAIWVNPHPMESSTNVGPSTSYEAASFLNIIGASLDPVALDYWASKHILIPTAIYHNYTNYSSLDPDYEQGVFHNYLNKSMNVLENKGFKVTMNETEMNIHVSLAEPVHNLDSGLSYGAIQEAINADETLDGHTIQADAGVYYEHVIVSKSVSIKGEDRYSTIINGEGTGSVISIKADGVSITGFTIQTSGHSINDTVPDAGINIRHSTSCNISGNRLVDNYVGIFVRPSIGSLFANNIFEHNHIGIDINNQSTFNALYRNGLHNNNVSIHVYHADFNVFFENHLIHNQIGAAILHSQGNNFFHNTLVNNTQQVSISDNCVNFWDDGLEGNYWNNYEGSDANNNGIGDIPHVIGANNSDNYPLMGRFQGFTTELGNKFNIVSNSTIEGFEYTPNSTIKFYVSNITTGQSAGFCRMTIPKNFLPPPYTIIIDEGQTEVLNFKDMIEDNGTHRWIYFNYEHSIHEIYVIPESPLLILIPLLILTASFPALIYRKIGQRS